MNYDELINAAKSYSDRTDVIQSAAIFIVMAEARINRALKTQEQTHRIYTNTIDGQEIYLLPDDYNGMRTIQYNAGGVNDGSKVVSMSYVTPERIIELQESEYVEKELYYTIVNDSIQIHPTLPDGGTLELVFYRKVPNLSSSNSTNWLSDDHPDIYLSGLMTEIELFVKNHESAKLWDSRMTRAITELKDNDVSNRWTGSSLTMRVE